MPWSDWETRIRFSDERPRVIAAFLAGPWYWPVDDAGRADVEKRLDIAMPAALEGRVPVVTVSGRPPDRGFLWVLGHDTGEMFHLDRVAREAWQGALSVLPHVVPALWVAPETLSGQWPAACPVWGWADRPHAPRPEPILDGSSFGLSFLVSQISNLTGFVPRTDTIASVAIDGGEVAPIPNDGLRVKVKTVIDVAPSIRRFLVHATQQRHAESVAGHRLEIVGVETVQDGVGQAFERPLADLFGDLGTHRRRQDVVDKLFRSACGMQPKPAVWRPFVSAATRAKADWPPGDPTESYKLVCARAFAERHETNAVTEPPVWPLPLDLRLSPEEEKAVFANLVQQSYDCGHPPAHVLLADFNRSAPAGLRQRSVDELKTTGALWRAQAKQGRIEDACRAQTELAEEWLHRGQPDEACYPLSEAYRLSGLLADGGAAFGRLDRVCSEAPRAAVDALGASPFVRLQRGRALLSLGESRSAVAVLRTVIDDSPALVRYSAARLLAQADVPDANLQAEMERLARCAEPSAAPGDANEAKLFLALEDLDRAVAMGDGEAEGDALGRLERMEPSLVRALLAVAADRGRPAGRTVAQGFPY